MTRTIRPGVESLEARDVPAAVVYVPPSPTVPFETGVDALYHASLVQLAHQHPRIAFVGDSLTHNWLRPDLGLPTWNRDFAPLKAANFGVGGDQTGNILWRWENGEFPAGARTIILQVGDNNFGDYTSPKGLVAGIETLVQFAHRHSPRTKILVIGSLPFNLPGFTAHDRPFFQGIEAYPSQANALLAKLPGIKFVNPYPDFLGPNGVANPKLYLDGFHPLPAGYAILGPLLRRSAPLYFR